MAYLKQLISILVTLCLAGSISISGEKHEVKWSTFNKGLQSASMSNKRMLIDVYTDWCGWCKKMDQDVYGNQQIVDYLDTAFILVKLNAESGDPIKYQGERFTEMSLATYFGVTGYPTTVFAEPDGKVITPVPGYIAADSFFDVARFIGEGYYKKLTWQEFLDKKATKKKK